MSLGPVSSVLEAELRAQVRRHGIVVWLDGDDHYTPFVDALAAREDRKYEVRALRGSYLALMLELEALTGGVERPRLVVHLPGFNEEAVKATPLYELYAAGVRFRKALPTLVNEAAAGKVRPEALAAFTAGDTMTLDAADAWLTRAIDADEGALASQLRAISLGALLDDLLSRDGYVASRVAVDADREAVFAHLATAIALPETWRATSLGTSEGPVRAEDVAFAAASWALSVEYVDDLRRPPVAPRLVGIDTLPKPLRATCSELAAHLRERHADFYGRTAEETEAWLKDETDIAKAEDLGRIDTFRFEEEKVLEAAIAALAKREWGIAAEYADARADGGSFWLKRDPSRQLAWQIVDAAARVGQAVALAGPSLAARDHHEALERYVSRGAAVDQAHRCLEQLRRQLQPQIPEFEALRARVSELREVWRAWADAWALEYNRLCRAEGFVPPAELQQRTLFDEVVRPMADEGVTAYFVIDALRFEMGEELYRVMAATPATTARLDARLAELPTNTEVGMNALAPLARSGRLAATVAGGRFKGFSTGEFRVHDPDTRRRAMHDRVGGATCPWLSLAEVLARDAKRLKQTVAQARLVVVHGTEIDQAGHEGLGPATFEGAIHQLRSAWQLLREAGVKRFVVTADHGFLLLDGLTDAAHPHGRKIDPKYRYVVSPTAADHTGEVRVPLAALGYDGVGDEHLMFPETTAPFDTGARRETFVHGGNSLEERVIPVITVVHRAAAGGSSLRYAVTAEAREGVAGMHCLEAQVSMITEQGTLDFGSVPEIDLALRVADPADVTVELCQTRGGARTAHGAIRATVGAPFEVFFRLMGHTEQRALVVLHHPSRAVDVEEGGPASRFTVEPLPPRPAETSGEGEPTKSAPPPSPARPWLDELPPGARQVFAHIEAHGICREDEAATMLGNARALRQFSRQFEAYAALAPFEARIEVVGGVKRYVREGKA